MKASQAEHFGSTFFSYHKMVFTCYTLEIGHTSNILTTNCVWIEVKKGERSHLIIYIFACILTHLIVSCELFAKEWITLVENSLSLLKLPVLALQFFIGICSTFNVRNFTRSPFHTIQFFRHVLKKPNTRSHTCQKYIYMYSSTFIN